MNWLITVIIRTLCGFLLVLPVFADGIAWDINVGSGWGYFRQQSINDDFIDPWAKMIDLFDTHLTNGPVFWGEVAVRLTPMISINPGYFYNTCGIEYTSDQWSPYPGETLVQKNRMQATIQGMEMTVIGYPVKSSRMEWGVGAMGALFYGSSLSHIRYDPALFSDVTYRHTAWGAGFGITTRLCYTLTENVGIGLDTGIRFMQTESLKDENGTEWIVGVVNKAIRLDFNGPYAGLYVQLF